MIDGIRVTVSRHACVREFRGWRRTNRNNRIARKWRKKYGPLVACRGTAYEVRGMGLVVCPCVYAKLPKGVPS